MIETEDSGQVATAAASRPFDVHRWSDYPELAACLSELVRELESLESRQRQRGDDDSKRFRDAVRCLVLDLYVAWKTHPDLLVAIQLGNNHYTKKTRYRALFLKWSSFKAAYDLLLQAGYINLVLAGFNDPLTGIGRTTRIKATPKLIERLTNVRLTIPRISTRTQGIESIILRNSDKRAIEYQDDNATRDMRAALENVNAHLQRQWIDLRITDRKLERLQSRMTLDFIQGERERGAIDLTRRTLHRIFNNGDWQQGGRFYGGWWQSVPKEYRCHITINDKRTSEVDYSTLHPALLYAQIGQRLDTDAYSIEAASVPRSLIKTTFNKMLNATGRINPPDDFSEHKVGMSWRQLQDAISERHAPIQHHFKTGYGLQLQRLDSDLAQDVMLSFIQHGHTCLPVHDSFIVHHALADDLKAVMVDVFKQKTGHTITVKSLSGYEPELQSDYEGGLQSATPDSSWFEAIGEYAGYDQRRRDWLSGSNLGGLA
jgi:hypothetical protein